MHKVRIGSRKLYFAAGILAILVGFLGLSYLPHYIGDEKSQPIKNRVEIVLTDGGFSPGVVTIAKGGSVTFSSVTENHFWPASNIHPYHSIYSDFDPKRPLVPGESWTFTFDEAGNWLFHDHLAPNFTGVVAVLDTSKNGEGVCDETLSNAQDCWVISITNRLEKEGLDAAFDEMNRIHSLNPSFASACHNFTHDIGLLAFGKYGDDVPLTKKASYCNDGFFHGYMEGFLTEHQNPEEAREFCDAVGEFFGDSYPLALSQCNHGIGHGTMEYLLHTRSDLWGNPIALTDMAIDFCDSTNFKEEDKFRCASGAYSVMGDWMLLQNNYESKFMPLDENVFWMCAEAEETWSIDGCVWEFSKRISRRMTNDYERALSIAVAAGENVKDGLYTSRAVRSMTDGLGQKYVATQNPEPFSICDIFSDTELSKFCVIGISDGLYHAAPPEDEAEYVAQKCTSAGLAQEQKLVCGENLLIRVNQSPSSDKISNVCEIFKQNDLYIQEYCSD